MKYNFNNKTFHLLQNSEKGEVDKSTTFHYAQEGDIISAEYRGGIIRCGKIIALIQEDQLDMLYQCITIDNELKAGKAKADISLNSIVKIILRLNWKWLNDNDESGESLYIES